MTPEVQKACSRAAREIVETLFNPRKKKSEKPAEPPKYAASVPVKRLGSDGRKITEGIDLDIQGLDPSIRALLTEDDKDRELRRAILEDSFEGQKLTVLQGLRKAFHNPQVLQCFHDRCIFECEFGVYSTPYLIENHEVCFPEERPTELFRVFLLKDQKQALDEILSRDHRKRIQDLRVAGLIQEDDSGKVQGGLTERQKADRRIAGV